MSNFNQFAQMNMQMTNQMLPPMPNVTPVQTYNSTAAVTLQSAVPKPVPPPPPMAPPSTESKPPPPPTNGGAEAMVAEAVTNLNLRADVVKALKES